MRWVSGFLLLVIFTNQAAASGSVGKVCRKAFLNGEVALSETSHKLGPGREIFSCLGKKGGDESIIIVESNGRQARTLVPARLFFRGSVVSSRTYSVDETAEESNRVIHPAYRSEAPVEVLKGLEKWRLFKVSSEYEFGDDVGSGGDVTEIYSFDSWPSRFLGRFDVGGWAEGGDFAQQELMIQADARGPKVIEKSMYSDQNLVRFRFVEFRLESGSFVAVSTRTCVEADGPERTPDETAIITTTGQICDDIDGHGCVAGASIRLHIISAPSISDKDDHPLTEVLTPSGRKGLTRNDQISVDCPLTEDSQ